MDRSILFSDALGWCRGKTRKKLSIGRLTDTMNGLIAKGCTKEPMMQVSDFPSVAELSTPQKLQLIEALWADISADASAIPVPESHKMELDRRLEQITDDPDCLITLEELKKRIERWK